MLRLADNVLVGLQVKGRALYLNQSILKMLMHFDYSQTT